MHTHGSYHNDHDHSHHHVDPAALGERGLIYATAANLSLTVIQVIGGVIAGSLAVLADALHNFGDAMILVLAVFALKIGKKPADQFKTFGYKRVENVAALISLTVLCLVGIFLMIQAVSRIFDPQEVKGWWMIGVTCFALIVDLWTVYLTQKGAKYSSNIHAAFLHNLMDALASVGVIIGGTLILMFGWNWVDIIITLMISGYAIFFAIKAMKQTIHILMDGAPPSLDLDDIIKAMEALEGVDNVHHVHVRCLNDQENALEAHVRVCKGANMDQIKHDLKQILNKDHAIGHSTLEFEIDHCCD